MAIWETSWGSSSEEDEEEEDVVETKCW